METHLGDPNILNPSANDSPGAITYSVLTSPTVISIISGNETSIDTVGSSIVSATIASSGILIKTVTGSHIKLHQLFRLMIHLS